MTSFDFIPSSARHTWPGGDIVSRQSFPATGNFDLVANAFGLLMVHNDDVVSPGEGFDMHFHKDVEIVSWIVEGAVRHRDSGAEEETIVRAGMAQAITAGSGVNHAEVNANGYSSGSFLRVIQCWLPTDIPNASPSHHSYDFNAALDAGGLVTVAGEGAPLQINTAGARMYVARLHGSANRVAVPGAPFVHLFVVNGNVQAGDYDLAEGDVLRCRNLDADLPVSGQGEILVWGMDRSLNE